MIDRWLDDAAMAEPVTLEDVADGGPGAAVPALATARLGLPLLAVGQGGKEWTHNEALDRIDALLHPVIVAVDVDGPPPADAVAAHPGGCWATRSQPTGAWAMLGDRLAIAGPGGWRFAPLRDGMRGTDADGCVIVRRGGQWVRAARVSPPPVGEGAGGTGGDAAARAALAALVEALVAQGLLAPPAASPAPVR